MKKLHFNCLIVISVLFFGTVNGFAQQTYTRSAFTEPGSRNTEAFRKYMQESNKKNEEWLAKQAKKKKRDLVTHISKCLIV